MPETMPAVENYMKIGSMKKEVSEDQEDYEKLRVQLVKLKRKIYTTKNNIKRYERASEVIVYNDIYKRYYLMDYMKGLYRGY